MIRVVILGARGFLGSPIAFAFKANGYEVISFSRSRKKDALLQEYQVDLFDSESLSNLGEQISGLISDPGIEERYRALAMDHFDMDKAITAYSRIYSQMIGGSH